jgi:hypothetical protein
VTEHLLTSYWKEIQMNTIINVRTLSAIAVLAISAGMPIASYAAAGTRVVDPYNEGSEPPSLQQDEATAPEATRAPQVSRADAQNVDSYNEGTEPASTTQSASSASTKLPDAVAKTVDSINEGD